MPQGQVGRHTQYKCPLCEWRRRTTILSPARSMRGKRVRRIRTMSNYVIVVGGGVIGCATAVQLAMRGVKHITLLEKGAQVAVGASGASGGLVRMHYTVAADACLA